MESRGSDDDNIVFKLIQRILIEVVQGSNFSCKAAQLKGNSNLQEVKIKQTPKKQERKPGRQHVVSVTAEWGTGPKFSI